jgi:hypothetical protein
MRESLLLTAIGSAALLTLAVASGATLRHATELSSKQRLQLDTSIDRIVTEQVARRDEVFTPGSAATSGSPVATTHHATAIAAADVTQLPPGKEARKEAARHRDAEERAEREARAATARPPKKRPPQMAALGPGHVLPQAFLSIRKLTFGVLQ